MRFLLLTLTIALLSVPRLLAVEALIFTTDFMEKVGNSGWQVVDSRMFVAALQEDFHFSMGNFGYTLHADKKDDSTVVIRSQVNCYDYLQRNFFDKKTVTLGATIFFDSALVRKKSFYRIRLTPDSVVERTDDCQYRYGSDDFRYDPSGDFDFYFVPGTLGDFHWNQIRDVIEIDFDYIAEPFSLRDPTKINFYISPCRVRDVAWDARWNNAFDLSRNNLFAHFNHGINSIHPQAIYMLKLLRLWGYSPAFLLEGVAGANEFSEHYARKVKNDGALPPLADMLVTKDYRSIDREISANAAASFVHYLIRIGGFEKLRNFYKRASDLTLADVLENIYGLQLPEAEKNWHHFIDTLTILPGTFMYHQRRQRQFLKQDKALYFLNEYFEITHDTMLAAPKIANLYFQQGDYRRAQEYYRKVMEHDSSQAISQSYYANLLLAEGKLTEAEEYYRKTLTQDTSSYLPVYRLGALDFYHGDFEGCLEKVRIAIGKTSSKPIIVDMNLIIGDAFRELGEPDSARIYYAFALNSAKLLLGSFTDNPLYALRVGKAAVRLGEPSVALEHLRTAFFLEERMFYVGQILLATGQAYDLLGEREKAKQEYKSLFLYPTTYLDQQLAEKYLKQPFTE